MGLERTAAVLQGKLSNFETDLIRPIIDRAGEMLGIPYDPRIKTGATLRIIADHARAAEFLIHDGVMPANEGRGYVLRKIMRRALRHARLAGREEPFLFELTKFVADLMKPGYPELQDSVERVQRIVREEELRYHRSFATAEREFEAVLTQVSNGKIPGSAAFKLYDTFGLSLDEQQEMARERELSIDLEGFETEMRRQRERARASWRGADAAKVSPVYQELLQQHPTKFLGYDTTGAKGVEVVGLLVNGQPAERVSAGDECEIILDRTPFYAESGGQVGDKGFLLKGAEEVARVSDTRAPVKGLNVHRAKALAEITVGDAAEARVDAHLRDSTRRNHTATHLLHAALRQVLGKHVKQAGSVVDPGRLRFDVTHYAAVEPGELEEVERIVNREILVNTPVTTDVMDLNQAVQAGAMALFGEKYGDKVRVVKVGDFSKELCGGTHVARTGDIGVFKITSEGSVSAGVRRLEAVTGEGAYELYRDALEKVRRIGGLLRAADPDVVEAVERTLAERREAEREIERLKSKLAQSGAADLTSQARDVNGVKVIAAAVDGLDRGQLRSLVDSLRNKLGSGVVVLGSAADGNVALICCVTKDLAGNKLHAGKIVGAVAERVGGRGGGRPDLAEAGGKNAAALPDAIASVYSIVETAG
jgi:alanyl-tRNA synthetase